MKTIFDNKVITFEEPLSYVMGNRKQLFCNKKLLRLKYG
jgi:hypothetical protein